MKTAAIIILILGLLQVVVALVLKYRSKKSRIKEMHDICLPPPDYTLEVSDNEEYGHVIHYKHK